MTQPYHILTYGNKTMGVLDWLFSSNEPKMIPAEPLTQFPTAEDAAFARKNGAFYGTAMDPFASGQSAIYFSNGPVPTTGRGRDLGEVTDPANAKRFDASFQDIYGDSPPNAEAIPGAYARSALAANRSAIASLGLDPRAFSMDGYLDASRTNVGGAYAPQKDHGYVIPGASDDDASTLVHEAIHRGMQKLREAGSYVESPPDALTKFDEEELVRLIMQHRMGDPESGPEAIKMKSKLAGDRILADRQIDAMEAAAAQLIAKQKPGGPR